ncbi:4Fe-4S binding protein [Vallitalea okinawensis]|uniref:4Fe-4S binding protein n=1 Tax=Vallitalea okinawensis TaxID=2078660 RepID=UPI001A9A5DBE|nr:4Fe-4S binding protein [Vallitalea okinawensis]
MNIEQVYAYADKIGVLVFSTIHGDEVHSRVAHFNGYDEEGIYFRTMKNKPFGRQLMATKKVTICGCTDTSIIGHEADGTPIFPPSYSFRLIGDVRMVTEEVIREKAKTNKDFLTAVNDMDKYPAMKEGNYVIYKAKGEIFDVDFDEKFRDHKLLRTRFSYGGVAYNQAGPRITDSCIACGKCKKVCTFKAIKKGSPYTVIPDRCDDCGSCILTCPVDAIQESIAF